MRISQIIKDIQYHLDNDLCNGDRVEAYRLRRLRAILERDLQGEGYMSIQNLVDLWEATEIKSYKDEIIRLQIKYAQAVVKKEWDSLAELSERISSLIIIENDEFKHQLRALTDPNFNSK